jgi:hypothetical protein
MGSWLRIRIASLLEQFDLRLSPFRRGRLTMRAALTEQRGARDRVARFGRPSLFGALHLTTNRRRLRVIPRIASFRGCMNASSVVTVVSSTNAPKRPRVIANDGRSSLLTIERDDL